MKITNIIKNLTTGEIVLGAICIAVAVYFTKLPSLIKKDIKV